MPEPGGGGWGGREGIIARVQMLLDEASAREVERQFEAAGQKGGEAFHKGLSGPMQAMRGMLEGIVTGIAGFFTARFLVNFARDSVQAFNESERAALGYRLAAEKVHASNETIAADLERMRQLAFRTPFGEEAIIQTAEQLTLNLRSEKEAMDALPVAIDLAASKHIDLNTAASLVSRAMRGFTENFHRYNIEIKDGLPVLDQLRAGTTSAEKQMTPWDRITKVLAETWHDLKEAIGEALETAGGGTRIIDVLTGAIRGATTWVKENHAWFGALGLLLKGVTAIVGGLADAYSGIINIITGVGMTVFAGLLKTLSLTVSAMSEVAKGYAWLAEKVGAEETGKLWRARAKELKDFADQMDRAARAAHYEEGLGRKPGADNWKLPEPWPGAYKGWAPPPPEPPPAPGPLASSKTGQAEAERMAKEWAKRFDELKKAAEESEKSFLEYTDILARESAALTETMVDDLEQGIVEARRKIVALLGAVPEEYQRILDEMEANKEAVRAIEPLREAFASLEPYIAKSLDPEVIQGNIDTIDQMLTDAAAEMAKLNPDTPAWRMWNDFVKQVAAARAKEVEQLAKATENITTTVFEAGKGEDEAARKAKEWKEHMLAVLDVVEQVASGLTGILDILGLSNDATRQLASGVGNVAKAYHSAIQSGWGAANILGLIGGGLSLLSGIGGILGFGGESEQDRAHRLAVEANTEALKNLASRYDQIAGQVSGQNFAGVQAALQAGFAPGIKGSGLPGGEAMARVQAMKSALAAAGLTWQDLKAVANVLGIDIGESWSFGNLDLYQALLTAIMAYGSQTAGGPKAPFSQQQAVLQAGWTATGAGQQTQFEQLLTLYGGAAPLLFGNIGQLAGPEQVARLKAMLNEYATTGIPREKLGKLTEAEYIAALNDLISRYEAVQEEAKRVAVGGEEEGVKARAQEEFGRQVSDAIDAATKRGGPASEQAKRVADAYQNWLTIRATAAGGPEGALAGEAYDKLQQAMNELEALMGTTAGVGPELTPGWSVVRTFSTVAADVVTGELRTHTIWLERIEGHLAAMRDVIAPRPGGVTIGSVTITGPSYMQNPSAWGAAAADSFSDEVDKRLGARYQNGAVLAGNASLP